MALTMQDRIDTNDEPTKGDLKALTKAAESGKPADPKTMLWLIGQIEYLESEMAEWKHHAGVLQRSIKAALEDFKHETD